MIRNVMHFCSESSVHTFFTSQLTILLDICQNGLSLSLRGGFFISFQSKVCHVYIYIVSLTTAESSCFSLF